MNCDECKFLESALYKAFFALGSSGANADIEHPLRDDWENARAALAAHAAKVTA